MGELVKCDLGPGGGKEGPSTGTCHLSCLQDPIWDVRDVLLGFPEAFLRKRGFLGGL